MLMLVAKQLPALGSSIPPDDGGRATQALAFFGREDRIDAARPVTKKCRADSAITDPLSEITRRAKSAQVVIINEAHDAPRDRAFIADVAAALRPAGFTTYAAETMNSVIGRDAPSYPRANDGYYIDEPIFGALIRRARALQYHFVAYEFEGRYTAPQTDMIAQMTERDEGEATNLVARIFANDPKARVLIHVGYAHAMELPQALLPPQRGAPQLRWMALRLKDKTGVDPLTIDQTGFGPSGDARVVCASSEEGEQLDPTYDVQLMAPALRFERGRPTWRIALGEHLVDVPAALKRPKDRVVFEAWRADEPADAVPVDRLLVEPGEDIPLLLAPGDYRVRACDISGPCTFEVSVHVT
jgi:hypothetical protein